jgi:gas vesicle protein
MSRFLLGFAIGFAIGAAAVIFTSPRPGSALRHGIGDTLRGTLDAARQASAAHERELWAEFRARLTRQG